MLCVAVVATQREEYLTGQVAALHDLTRAVMVVVTAVGQVTVVMLFGIEAGGAVLEVQEFEGVVEPAAVRWVH
jgi:hypothetical protein